MLRRLEAPYTIGDLIRFVDSTEDSYQFSKSQIELIKLSLEKTWTFNP